MTKCHVILSLLRLGMVLSIKDPFIARTRHAEFYEFASFHPFLILCTHNSNKVKLDVEIACFSKFMDKGNNRSLSSTHTVVSVRQLPDKETV